MLRHAPRLVGAARVLNFIRLANHAHSAVVTAGTTIAGLAICQYEDAPGFYLFGCDTRWQPLTDTWHEAIDDARDKAEADFGIKADAWETHEAIWVYCRDCKRCYRIGEERLIEGYLWCAYSDCDYGDIQDAIGWSIIHRNFPYFPAEPTRDQRYLPKNDETQP